MSATFPPLPTLGQVLSGSDYQIWDINIRFAALQAQQADVALRQAQDAAFQAKNAREEAALIQYRLDYLAAMTANTAAINDAASGIPAASTWTEADLTRHFTAQLIQDWGTAGRGPGAVTSLAKQLAQAYKALYPTP